MLEGVLNCTRVPMLQAVLAPFARRPPVHDAAEGASAPSTASILSHASERTSASARKTWRVLRATPRIHPPPSLERWGDALAWCLTQPGRPRSFQPLVFPCMPGAGKLGLSYGSTLVGRSAQGPGTPWIGGAVAMVLGAGVVLWGVVALGNAVGHVHGPASRWIKAASIGGGVLMAAGYGLNGLALARPGTPWASDGGIALKWVGTSAMAFTLPTFVVHGVAVLGNLPFHRHRGSVAAGLLLAGVATLVASPTLTARPHMPLAASQAAIVVASFACLLATGIYSCSLPSYPFQPSAHRDAPSARLRYGGTAANALMVLGVGGLVGSSSLRSSSHVQLAQAQGAAGAAGVLCLAAAALYVRALPPWPWRAPVTPLGFDASVVTPPVSFAEQNLPIFDDSSLELGSLEAEKPY